MVFRKRNLLSRLRLYFRSYAAFRYAIKCAGPGLEFGRFGKKLGWQLFLQGVRSGLNYIVTPVDLVRYFEFPFAFACLLKPPGQCLDVSSPRLFSLYVARQFPSARLHLLNPDAQDLSETAEIARRLKIRNIHPTLAAVDRLPYLQKKYDCIWSISVVEHISGRYEDSDAVQVMYDALTTGGRLILTVPVDRTFWDEYRAEGYYGIAAHHVKNGNYFFQHFYDKSAIWDRLLAPIGKEPQIVRWFGETSPGRFMEYTERWIREGNACTVDSPKEIVDHYREFATYEEMPGIGVCGLLIEKN